MIVKQWNTVLNALKYDLLGKRDRSSLIQSLAIHLPEIGITTAAIVLYNDEKTSMLLGGFSPEGISPVRERYFPVRLLVPAELKPQYSEGVFMVQPLFIENRSLGYFVHNVFIHDGLILEDLRSSISYALKGIFLQEEAIRTKRMAEQAEQAKTEFAHILENGLNDLALGVTERLESLEKKLASGTEDRLIEDLRNLKSFVNSREDIGGGIPDCTLARIDDLSLKKILFDPRELLPDIGSFPLLLGDTERLAHCFSLIRGHFADGYSVRLTYRGLSITFHKNRTSREEKGRRLALLFAQRIILMHKGNFSLGAHYCTVILPWTTLTGQDAGENPTGPQDFILVLSDPAFLPAGFFTLPQIRDLKRNLPGRIAFIAWNAAGATFEDMVKIAGLRHNGALAGIPFLCYGMPRNATGTAGPAASLIDAVEFALKSPKQGVVLLIGCEERREDISRLFMADGETNLKKIHLNSMSAFNETVSEITPLLIIFNTLDAGGVAAVRRHPLTVMVPILMISERIQNSEDVTAVSQYSRLILCHHAIVGSSEFQARVRALIEGDEILSPHTGALVKKAILYFDQHAKSHISRWKLANTVNASEDYLTRIFHREMGLSLWDYLSRYRIFLAVELLRQTDDTIQDIAGKTGFQDQAYFCRVFKKIYGIPPGQLRKQKEGHHDGKIQ